MKLITFRWRGIKVQLRWDTRKLCHFYRVIHPRHQTGVYCSRSIDKVFQYIDQYETILKLTTNQIANNLPASADDLSPTQRIIDWQTIHNADRRTARHSDR